MKMKKRFLAIMAVMLTLVLSVGMLSGCGSSKRGSGDGVLKMYHFKEGQNRTDDQEKVFAEINKILKEKIGRTIEVEFIDIGAYKEKMQMIYASGEEFDISFNGFLYWTKDAVAQGALMDITDYLDEVPTLKESIPQWLWDATAVDGRLYSVPNQQIVALGEAVNVRKDLAEKYGLDTNNVKSYYDLKPFLDKIKENETDIYPVRGFINEYFMTAPMRTAYTSDLIYYYWNDEEFKVCTDEPFYDLAVQAHRIYADGYTRPDIATYTDDTADHMAGKYAVMDADDKPGGEAEVSSATGGHEWINIRGTQGAGGKDTGTEFGISATSKDPVGALKFIELMNTDKELYNMFLYGLEGVHYNKVGENRVELIPDSGYCFDGQGWRFGNTFNAYLMPGQPDDVWEITQKRNDEAPKSPIIGFNPDTSNLQIELAQCLKVKDEYKKRVERGYENPDTYWEDYTKKMKEAGIEKIREEFEKQLADFLASKCK